MPSSASRARNPSPGLPEDERVRLGVGADVVGLPRAWGPPLATGRLRARSEDFRVAERLPFDLTGEGEHLYLRIRKTGQNTRWVAQQLASACGLRQVAVGFAGQKDRHAVTEQWFSLHLPGQPDPSLPELPNVEVLEACRHSGKLRTGAVAGNDFELTLRDIVADRAAVEARLSQVAAEGVPNYFGPQRFGHRGGNLDLLAAPARRPDRHQRSYGLSALRAALFNLYLATRVEEGTWQRRLDGEIKGRPDDAATGSGLLWGVGENLSSGEALRREVSFFEAFPGSLKLLTAFSARTMRRALRVRPSQFAWQWTAAGLVLNFGLPKGAYATSLVRELGEFSVPPMMGEE